MEATSLEFDAEHYQIINRAREDWLRRVIGQLPFRDELRSALDVGCGAGYFSGVLGDIGFDVTGVDLRSENIDVCRKRYPDLAFAAVDLDGDFQLPQHDLVLLFGILYHLQSPLLTLQRLSEAIGRLAIVSTRVAAGEAPALYLFEENQGRAHNCAAVTAVPTLPALVAMFQLAGLEFVYRPDVQPEHPQWDGSAATCGRRHSLVVSREPLPVSGWQRLEVASFPRKWESPRAGVVSFVSRRFRRVMMWE